jgi:hypothetical protein
MTPDDSPTPPPSAKATLPNRAPDAVREGEYLVVKKRGAKLPPGCALCNAPEAGRVVSKVRKFNLPIGGLVLVLSPLLLIMYLVSPLAQFEAGRCSAHVSEIGHRMHAILKGHYSDRRHLWVAGVSPEYLQQFPDIGSQA